MAELFFIEVSTATIPLTYCTTLRFLWNGPLLRWRMAAAPRFRGRQSRFLTEPSFIEVSGCGCSPPWLVSLNAVPGGIALHKGSPLDLARRRSREQPQFLAEPAFIGVSSGSPHTPVSRPIAVPSKTVLR